MLRKLMKYELRATGRIFLPVFGALLILSLINKLFYSNSASRMLQTLEENGKGMPIQVTRTITAIVFGFLICAIFVLAMIVMVQRFYKNLLGDEGYLMFTLPVRPWQHITSKAIISSMWIIVSGIVTMLAIFILVVNGDVLREIPNFFRAVAESMRGEYEAHAYLAVFEVLLMTLVYLVCEVLSIYLAIALGQLWSTHKILGSFGAYIGLSIVSQVAAVFVGWMGSKLLDHADGLVSWVNQHEIATVHLGLWLVILWGVLFSALYFFATNWLLQKKLNLE